MRTYLATLHKRSPEHKKRFAFLTSLIFTLSIFTIWSVVKFDTQDAEIVRETRPITRQVVTDVTPLDTLKMSFAAAFASLRDNDEVKKGLEVINTYGR